MKEEDYDINLPSNVKVLFRQHLSWFVDLVLTDRYFLFLFVVATAEFAFLGYLIIGIFKMIL